MTPEEALCFFESFLETAPANPYSDSARVAIIAIRKMMSEAPSEDKSACESSLRLCLVQGRMAIFHKWIVKTSLYIKCNGFSTVDEMKEQRDFCLKEGVVPHSNALEKVENTYALIEYEDGYVDEIEPHYVRFIDGKVKELCNESENG